MKLTSLSLVAPLLVALAVATQAEGPDGSPAAYRGALDAAGLAVVDDTDDPRRWFVDYEGAENDWRITVYLGDQTLFLSALILEAPPGGEGEPPPVLDAGTARLALRRSFDLSDYKYALHPDGRRLYLCRDLPREAVGPDELPGLLAGLVAALDAEARVLREGGGD